MPNDVTTAQTPALPAPGSDEYNQLMADKYENPGEPDVNKPDAVPIPTMPEGGVEKFYDKETGAYNWRAHAVDAEYRLGQTKGKEKPAETPAATAESEAAVKDIVADAGLKYEDLQRQIIDNGKLDDSAYQALVAKGIPQVLIDEHVSLLADRREAHTTAAIDYAGGEEAWNAMSLWAASNLDPATREAINGQLGSADWQKGIDTLRDAYRQNAPAGAESILRQGDQAGGGGGEAGYASRAEMMRDQQDPKYRTDAAFRAKVIAKIAATDESKLFASYDA